MKVLVAFVIISMTTPLVHAQEREMGDFNFDGYQDYRVLKSRDGKRHFYDHFLFDPQTKKHMLNKELSGLVNPIFEPKTHEIRCLWPAGGHSGAIFYEEDYAWQNGKLTFLRTVRQTDVDFGDGRIRYVRVTSILEDGKPRIESIERGRTPNE